MELLIPKLERIVLQEVGDRNYATQLLEQDHKISLDNSQQSRYHLTVRYEENQYYFTHRAADIPPDEDYVLLTNKVPSVSKFNSGEVIIKRWLKHPKMQTYSVKDVINSWKDDFFYKEEDTQNDIKGLRQPQIAAVHSIIGHLKMPLDAATVVMPTGTGKTETMLSALIANRCERLLVTVPSDSLRDQISGKFYSLGLLKDFNIIGQKSLYPIIGVIKNRFQSTKKLEDFFESCNVIVTTMTWLTLQPAETQDKIAKICSHVFIDEAHHVKAHSWNEFRNRFPKEKVIQFTATPFRNDGKRLDGRMISNFPLKKAQEQGYYKKIEFIPVREYDNEKADLKIAEIAIQRLKDDIAKGFNHILMARCATKSRADEIYKLYQNETSFAPVVIYSNITGFKDIYEKIVTHQTRIIVCVDMLGEGFDLPELKIAAFHDIRKSLPITLQLAGRFTRTKYDEELGEACFIANIADLDVRDELADLYAVDADWNELLSDSSSQRIDEQVEFTDFMEGFRKLSDSNIPFQNIKTKLSTVIYKMPSDEWFPTNFKKGINGYDELEYKFHDINQEQGMMVIITGRRIEIEWVHLKDIYNLQWDIMVIFFDPVNKLLFVNSSDNGSVYPEVAKAIGGEKTEIIKGVNVFRAFYNVKRVKLQNVGLRQFLGKNIRFRMMMGSDVGEALSLAEKERGEKAFVMGTGFENGNPVNIGASYKGRIWTKLIGDLKNYKKWCIEVGKKIIDESIDANQILKETLIPVLVDEIPNVQPVWIDWDVDMYADTETRFRFYLDGIKYDMSSIELCLKNPTIGEDLLFSLKSEEKEAIFKLELFKDVSTGDPFYDFKVSKISTFSAEVKYGSKTVNASEFFENYIPTIWFADGSALTGNEYVTLKQAIGTYPKSNIIDWDWTGVDLSQESQHVNPKRIASIQYKVIEQLKKEDFDIIYDDDYSGEIADIVAIKQEAEKIHVKFYHLKYAVDGLVSNQIKNFYEVCGQAQKSIHWKHKDGKEFINHLLRRETKTRSGSSCSRLEKGTYQDLTRMLNVIKNEIPVEFEIYIVQPGLSKANASNDILTLLGVTDTYMKEFADINLKVIASS